MKSVLFAVALFAGASAASAHDVTLYPLHDKESVKLDIYYGDPGDYQPIDKVKLVELINIDSKGQKIQFARDVEKVAGDPKKLVTSALRLGDFAAGTYVLSSKYDNGFYIHDGENRAVATTLEWKSDVIDSAHYQKFSKALYYIGKPDGGYGRVLGHRVEFVPQADPFSVKDGGSVPILLLVDGKPLPNYKVEIGDDTAASKHPGAQTDAKGVFLVPLDHKGFYRLAVDYRAKSPYPALYEWDDYTASLIFER